LKGRRNPFVAREGIPFLAITVFAVWLAWQYLGVNYAVPPAILFVYFFLLFRDPRRKVPAVPLGIVSPVDGTVADIGLTDKSVLDGEAHKIIIRVNSFGTYTARCPVEGKIMDFRGDQPNKQVPSEASGLWVRTDEDDDVILQFHGHRFGLAPRAFLGYGERVGQGQRCAYLRLTRFAEVQLPINGRVLVTAGQRVAAGSDVLAKLPHA
jgi:phosphatidylserine decarboxylase